MTRRANDLQRQVLQMVQAAQDQGFKVSDAQSRERHIKVFGKDGRSIVVIASSPSDPRGVRNARARLRQLGVDL